jgi:hypothetical protein
MFMPQAVFKDADREPWLDLARHNRMAAFVGGLLISSPRAFIADRAHAALRLGLAAFILIPVLTGFVGV